MGRSGVSGRGTRGDRGICVHRTQQSLRARCHIGCFCCGHEKMKGYCCIVDNYSGCNLVVPWSTAYKKSAKLGRPSPRVALPSLNPVMISPTALIVTSYA